MWCVGLFSLHCVLLWTVFQHTTSLRLADCSGDHDAAEMRENTSGGQTVCEDIDQDQQIELGLVGGNGQVAIFARCSSPNQPCQNVSPALLTATRSSMSSTLNFVANATRPVVGGADTWSGFDVICRPLSGAGVTCPIDIIYPPSSSQVSCSVSTTTWNIAVSCDVSKAYSARNRYNCDVRQGSSTDSKGSSSYSSGSRSGYVSGTCTSSFPMPTSPGTYTYTVIVYPGVRTVSASPAVTVVRPIADPVVSCNDQNSYIRENTPLTCTCTASDLGQPQGRLLVYRGNAQGVPGNYGESSVQFGESSVSSADNNAVYRCVLDWATADNQDRDTTFTLKVAYGPSSADLTNPPVHELDPTQSSTQLTLTCTAVGVNPSATYIWSGSQCAGTTQSTCSFTPTKDDDGAVISCTAVNPISNVRKTSGERTLTIHYLSPIVTPLSSNKCLMTITSADTCVVKEGQQVHFNCSADSNPSLATAAWQQGSASSLDFVANRSMSLKHVCHVTTTTDISDGRLPLRNSITLTVLTTYASQVSEFTADNSNNITVSEGDSVTMTCTAVGRPTPAMSIVKDNVPLKSRQKGQVTAEQQASLTHILDDVTCDATGQYLCDVDNGEGQANTTHLMVFVKCSPRLQKETPMPSYMNYKGGSVSRVIPLTVYPTIHNGTLQYFGPVSDSTAGRPARDTLYTVHCTVTQSSRPHLTTCNLTITGATQQDMGFYDLTLDNGVGQPFTFQIQLDINGEEKQSSSTMATAVAVGVTTTTALILLLLPLLVWMWGRHWVLPCATSTADQENGRSSTAHMPMAERRAPRGNSNAHDIQDTARPVSESQPSPSTYESLRASDIGVRSEYSSLHAYRNTGAALQQAPVYENTGPHAVDPAYVNARELAGAEDTPYVNMMK